MIKFTTVTWYSQVLAVVLAIGIFCLGIFIGQKMNTVEILNSEVAEIKTAADPTMLPNNKVTNFSWSHKIVDTNADYPKSLVSLYVTRADGSIESKIISTVDGSCNELLDAELGGLNSTQLLCYYAGFGYQFRIINLDGGYAVQQKEIEEASPDYNPPLAEFETILLIGNSY